MNHKQATEKLGNRQSRKLENNTYLQRRNEKEIAVELHNTDIITMKKDGTNALNTGGWKTLTTKDRLNKYSGACVRQDQGQWFVRGSIFYDGMKVKGGAVVGKNKTSDKTFDRHDKLIKEYCKELKNLDTLPAPSNGDCWLCLMRDVKTSKTWGEISSDTSHLISHLKEKYIHGSLIINALEYVGYSNPGLIFQMDLRNSIVRAVRRYFKRQLGMVA